MKCILTFISTGLLILSWTATAISDDPPKTEIPPVYLEGGGNGHKTAYNDWTGDARIRLRKFHAFLFVPTRSTDVNSAESKDASRTARYLRRMLDSFSNDFVKRGEVEVRSDFFRRTITQVTPTRTTLIGQAATWDGLTKALQTADIGSEDVVFLWIQTHGQNLKEKNGALLYDKDEAVMKREDVRAMIVAKDGRRPYLTVFITDRCSLPAPQNPTVGPTNTKPPEASERGIWRALYFGHYGFVDVDSSSPNEAALIDGNSPEIGSIFARAFSEALDSEIVHVDSMQVDQDSMVKWRDEFLENALKTRIRALFNDMKKRFPTELSKQHSQTPRLMLDDVHENPPIFGPVK